MKPAELVVRPALVADAKRITVCIERSFSRYVKRIGKPPGPMLHDYKQIIEERQVLVAEIGPSLAGVLVLSSGESKFTLDVVAVDPESQGRGIGQHLIRHAEDQARHAGCRSIHLCTHVLMSENQALYSKLGYETYDRRIEDGYDRVFMRKSLS